MRHWVREWGGPILAFSALLFLFYVLMIDATPFT